MEATMVCIDNSEWTRNGDFAPSRFQSQSDAVNLLAGARTQAHPENTVGILTMAGKTPTVLVTPTPDLGKVLHCMHDVDVEGECNVATAVQIAQLCLKHRQNKNQRQRVVIFSGSPVSEDKDKLVKIGKKLKKNNVAVDIVSFSSDEDTNEKLEAFHAAVNSSSNSNFVTVPPGPVLSDALISSPIFQTEGGDGPFGSSGGGEGGGGGGGGGDFEFGVDPSLDPELALALRVSLEEERARQNAAAAASGEGEAAAGGSAETPAPAAAADEAIPMDEDALLQQALAMSMAADSPAPPPAPVKAPMDADMGAADEDADLQLALQMSMTENMDATTTPAPAEGSGLNQALEDPEYMRSVISSLPGVDPNDPAVKSAIEEAQKKKEEEDGK